MHPILKRVGLYAPAAAVVAALLHFGLCWQPPPDPEMVLLQAEIKLRFAARLPAAKPDGTPVPQRQALLTEACALLDDVEALAPKLAALHEYRGYVSWLRGDPRAAAASYRRARQGDELSAQGRGALVLNEARMLREAGDEAAALHLLDGELARLSGDALALGHVERSRIAAAGGDSVRARSEAETAAAVPGIDTDSRFEIAMLLEELGQYDVAEATVAECGDGGVIVDYLRARLKVRRGDVDSALDMLEKAVNGSADVARKLARRDHEVWAPCASNARFGMLIPDTEAAQPGR